MDIEVICMQDPTRSFSIYEDNEKEVRSVLTEVYNALREKGYNPINQLVGYILSEDPTYITTYNNARSLIRRIDRDELLQILLRSYLRD
jgi:YD repeat-containing protein